MTVIEEWRQAWRWFSLQAMVLVAAIQGGWAALPDDLKQHFPSKIVAGVSVALLVLGVGGRLVKQRKD
jgi:hypothetical protein